MGGSKEISVKKVLYILIVVLLSAPLFQMIVNFPKIKQLKGAIAKIEQPEFSVSSWLNSIYQTKEEEFVNTNFGFRAPFVRLHNQIDYWLYNKVYANNVIIGKDGYLYELSYINEYLGRKFVGKKSIKNTIANLKKLADTLAVRDIDVVVLLAAGKASYLPEYFPDSLSNKTKTISNYEYFSKMLDSANILTIDFNSWFLSMKDTTRYPLYTKGGIHWSKYAEYLVADSIIKYVENLKGVKLPQIVLHEIEISSIPRYRDNDIGEGMNLIFPHSTFPMAYPKFKFDNSKSDTTFTAMVIADSYYWELFNEGLSRDVFNNGQFWYYNEKIYSSQPGWYGKPISEVDVRGEVEKNDIVFIMQTEATLDRFGFGFIEKQLELYEQLAYNTVADTIKDSEIEAVMQAIKGDDVWYKMIKEKAKKKGISTEEMLRLDAKYNIEQQKQ